MKIVLTREQIKYFERELKALKEADPNFHMFEYGRMPEPTPYQRGVLDRYQDKRHTWKRGRRHAR